MKQIIHGLYINRCLCFTYLKIMRFPKIDKCAVYSSASHTKTEVFRRQFYFMLLSKTRKTRGHCFPLNYIGGHLSFWYSHREIGHLLPILVLNFSFSSGYVLEFFFITSHATTFSMKIEVFFFTMVPSCLFHFTLSLIFSYDNPQLCTDVAFLWRVGYVA